MATKATLKTALLGFANRPDLASVADTFIDLAHADMNAMVRHREMITSDTPAQVNGEFDMPADMRELLSIQNLDNTENVDEPNLDYRPVQEIAGLRRRLTGQPVQFYTFVGKKVRIAPIGDDTLDFLYYAEIPALAADGDTNWLLEFDLGIYMYASLLHLTVYLKKPLGDLPDLIRGRVDRLVTTDKNIDTSGDQPLVFRPRQGF